MGVNPLSARRASLTIGVAPTRAALAIAVGVLLAEVIVAAAIAEAQFMLLVPLVAGLGLALTFRFPVAVTLVMLGLTSFIFHASMFATELAGIRVRPHQLLLAALLVVAVVRPRRRTLGGWPGAALAGFLAVLVVASVLAILAERTDPSLVLTWGDVFAGFLLFYVVIRLFPDARSIRPLLVGGAVLGALTGVVALVLALGSPLEPLLQGPGHQVITRSDGFGNLNRVRLAGLALSYGLFWFAAVQVLHTRGKAAWLWAAVSAGMALDILLSFNRNMWLGLGFGFALMLVLAGTRLRHRLLKASALGGVALVLLGSVGVGALEGSVFRPLLDRGASLLDPESVSEEDSLTSRGSETRHAWETTKKHPVTGVGPGAAYGMFFNQSRGNGRYVRTPQRFLHNQYLYLALIGGVPALGLFVTFLGLTLRRAWVGADRRSDAVACGVGLASIALSAVVMIYFSTTDMVAVVALLAGAVFVLTSDGSTSPTATARA